MDINEYISMGLCISVIDGYSILSDWEIFNDPH